MSLDRSAAILVALSLMMAGCGKDPAKLMEEGQAAFELGLLPAALERYKEVEKNHAEQFPQVYEKLGDVYVSMQDLDRAFAYWKLAAEKNPQSAKLRNKLGAYLLQSGKAEAARGFFEEALRLAPQHHESVFNLGVLALQAGELEESVARFEVASQLKPGDATILRHLGIAYSQVGRSEDAADALFRAWKANPEKAGNLSRIFSVQLGAERWAQAAEVGEQIASGNADPLVMCRYSYALWRSGNEARARDLYQALAGLQLPPYLEHHVQTALRDGVANIPPPGVSSGQ